MDTPAIAKNWEVRSENFVLITDDRQDAAEKTIADLEEYRQVIMGLWVADQSREIQPVRIYAFKNKKTFEKVTGRPAKGFGGLYRSKREGPIFVLNWSGGASDRERVQQTAQHEYTHHLLSQYSDRVHPKWYIEGFCEYLSTLTRKDNQTYVLGHPVKPRLNRLNKQSWLPVSEILGAVKSYPFSLKDQNDRTYISKFYAQSWLYVAYIHSRPELASQTSTYLELISSGTPSLFAFEQAYGLKPEEFNVRAKDFFKARSYPSIDINISKPVSSKPLQTYELSDDTYALRIAEAMNLYLSYGKFLPEKLTQFEKAENLLGTTKDIIAGKASVLAKMKKYDAAIQLADKGLMKSPNDSTLNQIKGHALYRKSSNQKPLDKDLMLEARKYFKASITANPENMLAHYEYVRTFRAIKDKPNKQAVASAKYALSYYKSKTFLLGNLGLAEVLIASGDYTDAKAPIEKALLWSSNDQTAKRAEKLKAELQGLSASK
jgi:hypothetical protein